MPRSPRAASVPSVPVRAIVRLAPGHGCARVRHRPVGSRPHRLLQAVGPTGCPTSEGLVGVTRPDAREGLAKRCEQIHGLWRVCRHLVDCVEQCGVAPYEG